MVCHCYTFIENEVVEFFSLGGEDDHPSEVALKLDVIRIYNWKLQERNMRKRYAIDRGLVDMKRQQQHEKRLSRDDRELVTKLKVFSRFHSAQEHESLVESLIKAKKLRYSIELLQHYRSMGLRSIEQVYIL